MRYVLLLSSFLLISGEAFNAALSENDCTTPLIESNVSDITGVFLRMRQDLSSIQMPGIPSSASVEQCEVGAHETLYIIKGRLHAGCFLGSRYQLLIKEKAPQFNSDHFRYEMEFSEIED